MSVGAPPPRAADGPRMHWWCDSCRDGAERAAQVNADAVSGGVLREKRGKPSIGHQQPAVCGERKMRVVRDFPKMPVGIREIGGISAPEHHSRRPDRGPAGGYRL